MPVRGAMERYWVKPGSKVDFSTIHSGEKTLFDGANKSDFAPQFRELQDQLQELQKMLYAQNKHRILVVMQAMDTGGKDGCIKHVFSHIDPQGIHVRSFKKPSEEELSYDFLWRVHHKVPHRGQLVIFNRSHYEDIIAVRVKKLFPDEVWKRRQRHVVDFERMLAEEGTTIVKIFLHISKKEQKKRLEARLEDPVKHWKFNPEDLADRARWEAAAAYSEAHAGLALLVLRGEELVFQQYNGHTNETPVHLFSGTKSFSCPLILGMEAEGLLTLDEPVTNTIPELAAGEAVTVRHLLDFTSGIEQGFGALTLDGMRVEQRVEDKYAYAVALPGQWEPGNKYQYGSSHQMVLGELVKRKTGASTMQRMQETVLDPISLRIAGWHLDPAGNPALPYGAWTTAPEWAKFGITLRDDGVWQGRRVYPEGVRDRCATGSAANPAYGLTFWLNAPVGADADLGGIRTLEIDGRPALYPDGPTDLFAAAGANDQRLYIVPSRDLVIVRLGTGHRRFVDADLLKLLLD